MEDLIYLLIALLWIVFSVVKGRQQQSSRPETDDQPKRRSPWEEILDEMLPAEPTSDQAPPQQPTWGQTVEAPATSTLEDYASPYEAYSTFDYQEDEAGKEIYSLEEIDEPMPMLASRALPGEIGNESQRHHDSELLHEFRKAVVYSAILERPHW